MAGLSSTYKAQIGGAAHGKKWLLCFLFLSSLVRFVDQINISIAAAPIAQQYRFDPVRLGTIFSAFTLGYMLFQIPAGWLGDRLGHKNVLILALVWWSAFTALTPWAGRGFLASAVGVTAAFWVVRFLIGLGEAATYPCANGIIAACFGVQERALAAGVMFAGVGAGSAVTPPLIAWIMLRWGWDTAFHICAAVGLVLALCFHLSASGATPTHQNTARSGPPSAPGVERSICANQESSRRPKTPWGQILRSSQLWLLTMGLALFAYTAFVYYSWFYLYLVDVRGFSLLRGSFVAPLPFLAMALGAPLGGWLSDRLISQMGKPRARRLVAMGGLLSAAAFIPLGATIQNAYAGIACLSLAAGSAYLALSSYWATAAEILPGHSATVSGVMNTGASLGGLASPVLTPWIAIRYGWLAALTLAACCSLIAATLWKFTTSAEKPD